MKQVLQSLEDGLVSVAEIPCPALSRSSLLIRTSASVISSGTERMLMQFGKSGWIEKARQNPDRVKLVLQKVKTDGIVATLDSVQAKLAEPIPMGYSSAGIVLEVGAGVNEFRAGDRVVSNGPHAEVVSVSKNLCARIPDGVHNDAAAFAVLGAIALEGVRLAQPNLGESVAVIGLGLIGLLTVQLLRANGCKVLAIDLDLNRLKLAEEFGAHTVTVASGEDSVRAALDFSEGRGLDAVLIAAATKSNEPVHQAALMSRTRGRIVLVGVTGLQLSRDDFYKKELSFQVSSSYGPGRYDPSYEQGGRDYPFAFARWTAQRNFQAVLDMLASRRIDTARLISHRFPFDRVGEAYELIDGGEPNLGVLIEYPAADTTQDAPLRIPTITVASSNDKPASGRAEPAFAVIGAGSYASKTLIPAFRKAGARLNLVVSSGGISAAAVARKHGFARASTSPEEAFANPDIENVAVATRHDSHAGYVCRALESGKRIFVEKPLALNLDDVDRIARDYQARVDQRYVPWLMVGFNRRFAPHVKLMKSLLAGIHEMKTAVVTVNAGSLPSGHWALDPEAGGGRIVGEACHFVDLLRFLVGRPSKSLVKTVSKRRHNSDEPVSFSITFDDGSIGTVHYVTTGHREFPKERVEVFCAGRVLQLDNFRVLRGWGWPKFRSLRLWRQDKGANQMAIEIVESIRNRTTAPIPFDEIAEVSRLAIEANE